MGRIVAGVIKSAVQQEGREWGEAEAELDKKTLLR
jgi:hypothetical protein